MRRYLPLLLLIGLAWGEKTKANNINLWSILERKFTIDYANDFSSQDIHKFISYFAPNEKIDLYQYGKDVTGNKDDGKHIKLFNGNVISSLIRLRIPARLMAKTLFNKLKEQNYKKSKIELLGISIEEHFVKAYIRFDRINKSEEVYQSARGIYKLIHINNDWFIKEMSTYDDDDNSVNSLVGFDKMFKLKGE